MFHSSFWTRELSTTYTVPPYILKMIAVMYVWMNATIDVGNVSYIDSTRTRIKLQSEVIVTYQSISISHA